MADLSNITLPNGDNYNLKDLVARTVGGSMDPILTKSYTGVIATANNQADGNLYAIKVVPDNYNNSWTILYKVTATIAGVSEADGSGYEESYVYIHGTRDTFATYWTWNNIRKTTYRPYYYHPFYRAKAAGVTGGYGHILGLSLRSSYNPSTTANARTVTFDILDYKDCTISFFDAMTKYASVPGTGSTNYSGLSEFDGTTNGITVYGDRNNYDRLLVNNSAFKCGSTAIVSGNIIVADSDGLYKHLKTGTAFDLRFPILFALSSVNANALITNAYMAYPFNVSTTQAITLTQGQAVFVKGSLSGTMFTPVSTTPLTQTLPSTEDGYEYIRLGHAYSSTAYMWLEPTHPIFAYRNGKWREVAGDAETVGGHSVNKDVPSNAVFTDTTALTSMTGTLAIGHGGTGGTTAEAARSNLGLGAAATYSVESTVANDSKLTTGSAVTAYVGDKIADKVDSIDIINGSDMPVRKQILCEPTTTFTTSGNTTYSGVFRFAGASYYQTYRNMQGGCYYPTEDCFILAIVDANSNNGILVKVNRSYEVISRGSPIGIGHGNDLTYCSADGKVYLAPGDDGPNAGKIIRINPTNLTLETVIDVGHSTYQIAYDEVNQRFFMLYSTTLYIHSSNLTLIKSITIDWNYLGSSGRLVRQVIFAYKGLFYLQSFSEKAANTVFETIYIQAFDDTGKVRSTAKYLPYFAGEEPEAICVIGSIAYVFSGHTWLNISRITLDNTAAVELNGDNYYAFGGKRIEQNSDLNDYLVLGKYDCPSYGYANSLSNCPYKLSAFTLYVSNHGHTSIRQEIVGLDNIRYDRILRVDEDYVAHYDDWHRLARCEAPTTTTLTGTIESATSTQIGTCSVARLSCGIITVTASFPQNAVGRRQVNINNTWLDGVNAVADDQTLITSTYFYNNATINVANVPIRLYQNSGVQLTYTVTAKVLSI